MIAALYGAVTVHDVIELYALARSCSTFVQVHLDFGVDVAALVTVLFNAWTLRRRSNIRSSRPTGR